MKRRLSFAVSTIGDPAILFLDEPTTGMDPMNRRHVWDSITRYKKGHTICLTTHLMEEADALGDTIGIMSKGRLVAEGTALSLKHAYGAGYQVKLVAHAEHVAVVKGKVRELMPSAALVDDAAGALCYAVATKDTADIPAFFEWVESLEGGEDGILEVRGLCVCTCYRSLLSLSLLDAWACRASSPILRQIFLLQDWGLSHTTLEEVFLKLAHAGASAAGGTGSVHAAASASGSVAGETGVEMVPIDQRDVQQVASVKEGAHGEQEGLSSSRAVNLRDLDENAPRSKAVREGRQFRAMFRKVFASQVRALAYTS